VGPLPRGLARLVLAAQLRGAGQALEIVKVERGRVPCRRQLLVRLGPLVPVVGGTAAVDRLVSRRLVGARAPQATTGVNDRQAAAMRTQQ
jgi:hypothetical protein